MERQKRTEIRQTTRLSLVSFTYIVLTLCVIFSTYGGIAAFRKVGKDMEPSRFDNLTKALATSTSRRQALKAIGATLGGALGLSRIGIAFADQCKPLGAKCFKRQQCCSGICSNGMCVAPTTTTTTTTTPPPTRVLYSCVCADSTRLPPICNLIPCTDDGFAVCAQACANNQGVGGHICITNGC